MTLPADSSRVLFPIIKLLYYGALFRSRRDGKLKGHSDGSALQQLYFSLGSQTHVSYSVHLFPLLRFLHRETCLLDDRRTIFTNPFLAWTIP